jgi:hypothetical protein
MTTVARWRPHWDLSDPWQAYCARERALRDRFWTEMSRDWSSAECERAEGAWREQLNRMDAFCNVAARNNYAVQQTRDSR